MTLSLLLAGSHNNNVVSSPSLGCSASQFFRPANFHRSYPAFDLPWLHTKNLHNFFFSRSSPPRHIVCVGCELSGSNFTVCSKAHVMKQQAEKKRRGEKNLCLLNRQESFSLESFESPRICLRHAILMDLRRENFSTIFFSSPLLLLVRLLRACDFELCRELTWISAADIRLKVSSALAVDFLDEARKLSPSFGRPLTATAEFQREIFVNFQKETRKTRRNQRWKIWVLFLQAPTMAWPIAISPDRTFFHY